MRGPKAFINLDHLKSNFDMIQKYLNGKRIMAVVKLMDMVMVVYLAL